MDFGKIFSRAMKYPVNPHAFLLLFSVNAVFFLSSIRFLGVDFEDVSALSEITVPLFALMTASVIVTILLMGLYVDNAAGYFHGKRAALRKSAGAAKNKFFRLLGTVIVMAAAIMLPLSLAFLGAAGTIAGIILAIIVAFLVLLAPYSAVLSDKNVIGSVKDSCRIVSRNKMDWLIFLILYSIINMAFWVVSLVMSFADADIATALLQNAVSTYTTLFAYSALSNFYLSAKKK